jgi:hypothetical protein
MNSTELLLQQGPQHHHQRNKVNNTSHDGGFMEDTTLLEFPTPVTQSSNRTSKRWKLSTSIFNIDHQQLQSKEEQQPPLKNLGNGSNKIDLLQLNNSEITTSIHHPSQSQLPTNVRASAVAAAAIQISSTLNAELQEDDNDHILHNDGSEKKRVRTINDPTYHSNKNSYTSSSNGKLRKCKECNKTYTSREGLRLHIRNVHLDDKQYICEICNLRFVRGGDLKVHSIRVHTPMDLRPCRCLVAGCGKSFATISELTRHNKRHHNSDKNKRTNRGMSKVTPDNNHIQ